MPKVSVIIPCFNAEKYIDICFTALGKQLFKDFEIIAIDDCSTDKTCLKIEEWKHNTDLSIKLIRNETNSGPAVSRNKGIAKAQGEYISFCDIDDWYDSDYLSSMISSIEEYESDLTFCGYRLVLNNGKMISHPLQYSQSIITQRDAYLLGIDSLCAMIVKRDIIKHIQIPDIRNGEDMAIIPLLIARSSIISITNKILYNYLCRSGSLSLSPSLNVVESLRKSFKFIKDSMPEELNDMTELIGIRNYIYGAFLNLFKISYNLPLAKEMINEFEANYPLWMKNKNINKLSKFKRVYVWTIGKKVFAISWLLSQIHKLITR